MVPLEVNGEAPTLGGVVSRVVVPGLGRAGAGRGWAVGSVLRGLIPPALQPFCTDPTPQPLIADVCVAM